MQDSLVRDALLTYAGDEPPMTFSSTDVLAAGRRSQRRRRFAALTGSVAVAGAAALGGTLLLQAPDEPRPPITVGGPVWTQLDPSALCAEGSAAPSGAGHSTVVIDGKTGYEIQVPAEPASRAAARLSCELMRVVPALLPGASFSREAGAPADTQPFQIYPVRVFDPARPAETTPPFLTGGAVVADQGGVGSIGFGFSPASESASAAAAKCTGPCVVRTGPHGEVVTVLTVRTPGGFTLVNISVHSGETVVFVSASNGVSPAGAAGQAQSLSDSTVGRDDLPLPVDRLIALASAPELTLFP